MTLMSLHDHRIELNTVTLKFGFGATARSEKVTELLSFPPEFRGNFRRHRAAFHMFADLPFEVFSQSLPGSTNGFRRK